jgi:hypothetical protein
MMRVQKMNAVGQRKLEARRAMARLVPSARVGNARA